MKRINKKALTKDIVNAYFDNEILPCIGKGYNVNLWFYGEKDSESLDHQICIEKIDNSEFLEKEKKAIEEKIEDKYEESSFCLTSIAQSSGKLLCNINYRDEYLVPKDVKKRFDQFLKAHIKEQLETKIREELALHADWELKPCLRFDNNKHRIGFSITSNGNVCCDPYGYKSSYRYPCNYEEKLEEYSMKLKNIVHDDYKTFFGVDVKCQKYAVSGVSMEVIVCNKI